MGNAPTEEPDKTESSLVNNAMREFHLLGWCDENGTFHDKLQGEACSCVCELLEVLSEQGHSGTSIHYVLDLFEKLAYFKPLAPLTGSNDEWDDISSYSEEPRYQNKRFSSVFKDKNGKSYWVDGRVFRDKDGDCYTNSDSRVYIEFPWAVPDGPEYVDVDE